jgi:hypothetical protein
MSNPARVLHDIYSGWRKRLSGGAPFASVIDLDSADGAREIAEAARALVRIDDILTGLERDAHYRVGVYRRQYPEWWKGLVSHTHGWGTAIRGDTLVTEAHMDEIEAFANFLDGKVWELDRNDREASLRGILDDARAALEADDELSEELRLYLHRLLREMRNALDDQVIGSTFDYGDAVMRLFVAFKAAEGESTKKAGLWTNLRTSILPASGLTAAIEGGSILIQRALGM